MLWINAKIYTFWNLKNIGTHCFLTENGRDFTYTETTAIST